MWLKHLMCFFFFLLFKINILPVHYVFWLYTYRYKRKYVFMSVIKDLLMHLEKSELFWNKLRNKHGTLWQQFSSSCLDKKMVVCMIWTPPYPQWSSEVGTWCGVASLQTILGHYPSWKVTNGVKYWDILENSLISLAKNLGRRQTKSQNNSRLVSSTG